MKTFTEFQEAALAIPAAAGVISKVLPAAVATYGAVKTLTDTLPTFMQARKSQDTKNSRGRRSEKPKRKLSRMAQKQIEIENKRGEQVSNMDPFKGMIKPKPGEARKTEALIRKHEKVNKIIKPKEGDITKEKELLKQKQKEITKPKTNEKKDASKTVKDYLKARKKEGETAYKIKQDAEIADKGPGDLLPTARKRYLDRLLSKNKNSIPEEAIANNASSGAIAGLPPDQPPMRKKKRYIYGGTGSRKMWMNNK